MGINGLLLAYSLLVVPVQVILVPKSKQSSVWLGTGCAYTLTTMRLADVVLAGHRTLRAHIYSHF
jgi:hypothetical protein